jgi:anti-sigma B factor antagonist
MHIHEQQQGAVAVLKPDGPVSGDDGKVLRERASRAAEQNMGRIVLDMSAVPFVDSGGLEALYDVAQAQGESGRVLCLVAANATLREVFELTGMASHYEYYEDVQGAIRSFL